jgi:hypothetical protein
MSRLVIRMILLCVAVPVGIAFIVSSPGHLAFWVVLATVFLVMVPGLAFVSWAWGDVRRLERSRLDSD